jgi:putative transposase
MPRKPREFEIGGIYHIVNRGVEKRDIFLRPQDYSRFILALEFFNNREGINLWQLVARARTVPAQAIGERLREQRKKPRKRIVDLLAFCLMPNHFHLILREIIQEGISLFMRKLGGFQFILTSNIIG